MIFINEWFPNPIGDDAKGEFVELYNSGSAGVNLNGWFLWTGGKTKKVSLNGFFMPAHGYLVLHKEQSKLSLKNTGGGLWLYGPGGAMVDHGSFAGTAPPGESFSRIDYETTDVQHFAFVAPTPGTLNVAIDNHVTARRYPVHVPLDPPLGAIPFLELLAGAMITILAAWAYIIYNNEKLSNIIFQRDPSARGDAWQTY